MLYQLSVIKLIQNITSLDNFQKHVLNISYFSRFIKVGIEFNMTKVPTQARVAKIGLRPDEKVPRIL